MLSLYGIFGQESQSADVLFSVLQPLMLIVPDVQDVYTPLETDVVVPLSEVEFYNTRCGIYRLIFEVIVWPVEDEFGIILLRSVPSACRITSRHHPKHVSE